MKKFKPIAKMGGFLCNTCRTIIRHIESEEDTKGLVGPVLCNPCLNKLVYNYPTKNKEGFTAEEYNKLLKSFPTINKDKFYSLLTGITCQMISGKLVIYHCDILLGLHCGLENREPRVYEWD